MRSLVRTICCLVLIAAVSGCSATTDRFGEVELVIEGAGLENVPGLIDSYSYGTAHAVSGDPPTTALVYEFSEALSMTVEDALLDYGFEADGVRRFRKDAEGARSVWVKIGNRLSGSSYEGADDHSVQLPISGGLVVSVSNR